MLNFKIYKYTFPNGKIYIGMTSRSLDDRRRSGYSHNEKMNNSIHKYGWKNIACEILFDKLTRDEACIKEIESIAKYKSNDPTYGYNISTGGESHAGCTFKHTEESKQKISKNNARYWKGKIRPKLKEEHAKKLITSRNIKVRCVETGQIFDSITDATKMTGATHIGDCLKGKFNQSGGFHWQKIGGENNS